jgi:CrcB protein
VINIILVGIGGFIGAVLRYLTSGLVQRMANGHPFPYGTLAVNVIGCLVIGLLAGLAESRGIFTAESRALVFVGVLGAFTTFSTFGYETTTFLQDGQTLSALTNIGVQLTFGLAAVWAGAMLARLVG